MRVLKKEEMSPPHHTIFIALLAFVVLITLFAYTLWWPNNDDTLPPEIDMERAEKVGKKTKPRAAVVARFQDKCSGLCPYNLDPVCGYDTLSGTSTTYSNHCVFTAAKCKNPNLKVLNQGRCPKEETPTCKKVCPDLSAPMCGYDSLSGTSKSYANGCEFSNAQCDNPNLQLLNKGPCPKEETPPKDNCPKNCYSIYAPVCGYDSENGTSKEYANGCELSNAQCGNPNLKILNQGPCPTTTSEKAGASNKKCSGICPQNYAPVCGYDSSSKTSKTYSNECTFSNEQCRNPNLKKLSQGPCPKGKIGAVVRPKDKCRKGCPLNVAPICGYDSLSGTSNSYVNYCEFSNEQCDNPNLTLLKNGWCPGDPKTNPPPPKNPECDKPCTNDEANVCAYKSGNQSYMYFRNKCLFLNEQCKDPSWIFIKDGKCPEALPQQSFKK